ncbi:MAG: PAS domain-containing protein [Solirubrobacterales bacterium]|nr:PAS domain-containing protein [Solirubrobacterales bacterium]
MSAPPRPSFDPESLLRSLMESVPGAVYRCADDADWTMLGIGDDIETISGYPATDFIASSVRSFTSIIHPDDCERVQEEVRVAVAAGRSFSLEYQLRRADGELRWVLDRGVRTVDRLGDSWLDGIIFDITERRAAEELLRKRDAEAARLAELQASRRRIVAVGDAERRRLERNLHDGAQQRLVAIALQLRLLEDHVRDDATAVRLLTTASDQLALSLSELRELARGIHPAVLERGLAAALHSLASRSPVPATVTYEPRDRFPEPIELAAYFVASEALANVAKYAHATSVSVRVRRADRMASIEVADNGIGGADDTAGSGLRGLADRVEALQGSLHVVSPPGAGTVITAELPCGP